MPATFAPGQRVVNEAEPDLGLGVVAELPDPRTLVVRFPATSQTRRYRIESAPLRRLVLRPGQEAIARDGTRLRVESVETREGLLVYLGDGRELLEGDLEDRVPLSGAADRMRAGHLGYPGDLELRRDGWLIRAALLGSRTRGLGGARIRLLDHQLYLAHRVSRMEAPRVLLADEVGLGKTIEAGLIFSALRALGRASRVLIVVPESLTHQWLAEMVRRFHELLQVVGREALEDRRPFAAARRALIPLPVLMDSLDQACRYKWDLVIVDEAHHLHPGEPAYEAIERLADCTRGLLLLTGTPARGGLETEFGLLKLVDPDRYPSFEAFLEERPHWHAAAEAARDLPGSLERLRGMYPEDAAFHETLATGDTQDILDALVDRHGPGRVLFRNRRERLRGLFPGRRLHPVPLEGDVDQYRLEPGDPRVQWLVDFLEADPDEKVLLIARDAVTVLVLQEELRQRRGAKAAVFHEGLSLVDRDRQAAWFAESDGAQVLLCSEIGSEGRNFQFAHHLVLFDLPHHPDVIEQRIGRLDRIGQSRPVEIHALHFPSTERLFRWHHEGLRSFEGPVEGGEEIMRAVPDLDLERTKDLREHYRREAQENVDLLVDLNSFREDEGRALRLEIEAAEASPALEDYISRALERFGVQDEDLATPGLRRIKPGDMMFVESLPGLRDDGMLATFRRGMALDREDLEFLTPDHPLVDGTLAMLLDGAEGTATAVRWRGAPGPGLLVQGLFLLEALGPPRLELQRYLPATPLLVTVDLAAREAEAPPSDLERLPPRAVAALVGKLGDRLDKLVEAAERRAEALLAPIRAQALARATHLLEEEQHRLEELRRVNPAVPAQELSGHRARMGSVLKALREAQPRLDSLRLVLLEAAQ